MGIRIRSESSPPVQPVSDRRLSPAERIALNRVELARKNEAEYNQFLEANPSIPAAEAQSLRQERSAGVQAVTEQAEDTLARTNSYVQAIPSAPADANDRRTLADRAIQEEQAAREAIQASAGAAGPTFAEGTQDPTGITTAPPAVAGAAGPAFSEGTQDPSGLTTPAVGQGATPPTSNTNTPAATARQAASATASQTTPTTTPTNATPTGAAATVSNSNNPLRLQFEPNPHNEYDRVAYVFKLCMISDLDAQDPGLLTKFLNNQVRKIVIAESGVTTGFAIGDVEITDSISPNFRNRSNMSTGLKIQILEPYGLTLPDKMFQASQLLGLRNWRLAPFILQLEFRYIKSDGSIYSPTGSQKLVRVYQVVVTDFDAQLKDTGTIYDVQASVRGNLGFNDAYQIIPQSFRIATQQGAAPPTGYGFSMGDNTVSTFFTELGSTMTKMYVELRQNNNRETRLPILIYKFIVMDTVLAQQEINFTPESNSRRASFRTGDANTGEILVSRGQSVTALVDDIMASLKNPAFFFQGLEAGGLIKIPVIECVSNNVGWDLLTNDYVREFTFFIRTKLSNRPIPNEEYGSAIQGNDTLQRARLEQVGKNLRKRYDYFYTGLNTEVINCDIRFNQLHVVPQSLLNVTLPMAVASAQSVSPNTDPNAATNIAERYRQAQRANSAIEARAARLDAQLGEATQAEADLIRSNFNAERSTIQDNIRAVAAQSVVPFEGIQEATSNLLAPLANTSAQAVQLRQDIRTAIERNRQQAASREFVEDINVPIVDNMLQLSYYADPRDILNNMARPVNIEAGGDANNTPNTTRPIVSSILQQIYDKSGQHLIEIDLEIRGDPYWLGPTDLERTKELLNFLNSNQGNGNATNAAGTAPSSTQTPAMNRTGMVDKYEQDANILLKFRSGVPPSNDTGLMNLKDDSTFFYGVYTVIECIHEFKSGKFTQKLKALRDALINIDQLRTADRTSTSATQPRQVAPAVPAAPQAGATPQVSATNPNASPQNLQRSAQAQEQTRPQETPATPPVIVEIPNNNGPGIVRPTLRPGYRESTIDRRGRYILPPTGE